MKYIIKPGYRGMIQFDDDNNIDNINMIDYMRSEIDWCYQVPEDGTLTIKNDNGTDEVKEVKKDDVVILFYRSKDKPHSAIVIDNSEWKENIKYKEKNGNKEYKEECEVESEVCCKSDRLSN